MVLVVPLGLQQSASRVLQHGSVKTQVIINMLVRELIGLIFLMLPTAFLYYFMATRAKKVALSLPMSMN